MTTLLLAGGGTGGHVFPMVAVADALSGIAPQLRLVFVGTSRGLEKRVVPERGYELELMDVLPIRGGGVSGALKGMARAAALVGQGRALVKRYEPAAVFSVGGYAAGPVSLAARLSSVPLALMEPNAVIGLANRLVSPFVQRAYTAFEEPERHFKQGVVLRSGVPIRGGFEARPYARATGALRVLVLGGSQGAKALNEAVPHALAQAGTPVRVVHQCGPAHGPAVEELYASLGARDRADVVPFIEDMPSAIAAADLVIGRAGASAVSEICAVGRPSVLVPYPFAAGDHQFRNAEALERVGAALYVHSVDATPERLAREIDRLAAADGELERMAAAAQAFGRPHAALAIARDLLALAGLQAETARSGGPSAAPPGAGDGSLSLWGVA